MVSGKENTKNHDFLSTIQLTAYEIYIYMPFTTIVTWHELNKPFAKERKHLAKLNPMS